MSRDVKGTLETDTPWDFFNPYNEIDIYQNNLLRWQKKMFNFDTFRLADSLPKEAKKQDTTADTSKWEQKIDELVYNLYELTEEIQIIENKM